MSKTWYPVIDYEKCTGCLACVEFCPHGVLIEEDEKPKVAHPQECVEFCRGCQKGACEFDAISFPPDLEQTDRDKKSLSIS